jgi:hypothetical protein
LNRKNAVVFIGSSAGELEWVLPIVKYLLDNNLDIKIVYITDIARQSVNRNVFLKKYLNRYSRIKCYKLNWLNRKIRALGTYLYFFKGKFIDVKLLDSCFSALDNALGFMFTRCMPRGVSRKDNNFLFLQWPSLKFSSRHRYWMEKSFINSIFFYFPHSTNIYSIDSLNSYSNIQSEVYQSRSYAMTGYPGDFEAIKNLNFDMSGVAPAYIGHPRYSKKWIHPFRENSLMLSTNIYSDVVKILVVSANFSYHVIANELKPWIDSIEKVVQERFSNYQIIVKMHPRELKSRWDDIIKKNPSIILTEESVLEVAHKVNFSITFLSSSAMDCFLSGTPVIEFINPEKIPIEDRSDNKKQTHSKEFGIVLSVSTESELKIAIDKVTSQNYRVSLDSTHPLFQESIQRSDNWEFYFKEILNINNIHL